MGDRPTDYIVVVQAPIHPLTDDLFAVESAFARHLQELLQAVGTPFQRLVLVAPRMSEREYESQRSHLGVLSAKRDRIACVPAHRSDDRAWRFWLLRAGPLWLRIYKAVGKASVVHSGLADDLWRPLMAFANLAALLRRRATIFVVDIDFRKNSDRYRELGLWSLRSYVLNRYLYDPLKWLQVWFAVRSSDLVLLKSTSMVRDFGRDRPNVRFFLDAAHAPEVVIAADALRRKQERICDRSEPLRLIHFGRVVAYKGLEYAIEAVHLARGRGTDVRLDIVGDGDALPDIVALVKKHRLEDAVRFAAPLPYGPALFAAVDAAHIAIATPRVEDTPRSAIDAMARGLPILAFDIEYFKMLEELSGAVVTTQWASAEAVAAAIERLARDRQVVAAMAERAVAFAADNTQASWLRRRADWTIEIHARRPGATNAH